MSRVRSTSQQLTKSFRAPISARSNAFLFSPLTRASFLPRPLRSFSQRPDTGGISTPVTRDFTLDKVIGEGAFARVRRARHKRNFELYALKIIDVAAATADADEGMTTEEIAEEIRLTISLNEHRGVAKVHDFYHSDDRYVIVVMELLRGGDLLSAVSKRGDRGIGERDASRAMRELFSTMSHVHERCIAHRDLKLENLLLAERSRFDTLKVADFGLARRTKTSRGKLSAQCGSPAYVAPEIILGKHYTPAVDMWACGVIMYALLAGELPFTSESEREMYQKIIRVDAREPRPGEISPPALDLIFKLLELDPVRRLTAGEALEHEWFETATGGGSTDSGSLRSDDGPASPRSHLTAKQHGPATSRVARRVQRDERDAPSDPFERRAFAAGATLFSRGDRAREVMLIESGEVEVSVTDENTGAKVAIGTRGAGEYVGEMAIGVDAAARDADVDTEAEALAARSPQKKNQRRDASSPTKPKAANGDENGAKENGWTNGSTTVAMSALGGLMRARRVWAGGRRCADVAATTETRVVVIPAEAFRKFRSSCYGLDGEVTEVVRERERELEVATANGLAAEAWAATKRL